MNGARFSLAFLLAGCAHSVAINAETLSPSALNSAPERYHGQTVMVRGFLTLTPEAHNLYQSQELKTDFERRWDADDPAFDPKAYQSFCLTIANPDVLMPGRNALNGTTITIKGKFIGNYLEGRIDLGACPLSTAIVIDVDDLKRRYPSIFAN